MSIIIPDGKEFRLKSGFEQDKEATDERAAKIAAAESDRGMFAPDAVLPGNQQHDYQGDAAAKQKNFDQKIYLFPPEYNALRRELEENWPTLWSTPNPQTGNTLGWDMAFDSASFIGTMNGALDLAVQYDSGNVAGICKTFLNGLRAKRGLSRLQ